MSRIPGLDIGRKELIWYGLAVALFAGLLYVADLDEFVDSIRDADARCSLPACWSVLHRCSSGRGYGTGFLANWGSNPPCHGQSGCSSPAIS